MRSKAKQTSATIIGGLGAVGKLFSSVLCKHYQNIYIIDVKTPPETTLEDDRYHFIDGNTFNEPYQSAIEKSELILLTTPATIALATLPPLDLVLNTKQCIIDTLSVKTDIVKQLSIMNCGCESASINPMFSPTLGFERSAISLIKINSHAIVEKFIRLVENEGAYFVQTDAIHHDKNSAAMQALTHATLMSFGLAMKSIGYNPETTTGLWPPPHHTLLAMLSRICSLHPGVIEDIQKMNPYAETARKAIVKSIGLIEESLSESGSIALPSILEELKETLSPEYGRLNATAQELYVKLKC